MTFTQLAFLEKSRDVFRAMSNIRDGAFLVTEVTDKSR